jgi:hypothetical protein
VARALDRAEMLVGLKQIDCSTLADLRDYALLAVLLITGRRRAKVQTRGREREAHRDPRPPGPFQPRYDRSFFAEVATGEEPSWRQD